MTELRTGRPGEPVDVLVALPAHDEADLIGGCLESVLRAVAHVRPTGVAGSIVMAVAAHRCTDSTADVVREVLRHSAIPCVLAVDEAPSRVGGVRARLIDQAAQRYPPSPRSWVLNTDADSIVPIDWIESLLVRAAENDAPAAIAGLVDLDRQPEPAVLERYRRLIAAGVHGHSHDHVYGANLAVRWDAYRAVGGFRPVEHGEDHDLVVRLRAAGFPVATPFHPRVITSARTPGRAELGLGALLSRLECQAREEESPLAAATRPTLGRRGS